ncbi:MAG TPA: S8 family serine peptidase [Bryobacteraceae bacterium]|nr:S8 family serine peptidase [Bryobacteraceae bacterium]
MKQSIVVLLSFSAIAMAQVVPGRYIVTLSGEPAATSLARQGKKVATARTELASERTRVQTEQMSMRARVAGVGGTVFGSVDVVSNALFVRMNESQAAQVRNMPGVKTVVPAHRMRKMLDHAVILHHITDAWGLLPNGMNSAGIGMKIGILDTGIDSNHPAFTDNSLTAPSGFPTADNQADLGLTTSKIIVVRNYTDDFSAIDIDGHGTDVAMCAGGATVTGPFGTITGAAPKAFLGNYKIFGGSTNTNDQTLSGINDAVADGMDVINLSIADPIPDPVDVDPVAQAVEAASSLGLITVTAAGNEGPEPNTLTSPAIAPSAIGVGSSESDRNFYPAAVTIPNVPAYYALPGDNSQGDQPITGTFVDVSTIDGTGLACNPLRSNSLSGQIAFIARGTCSFEQKLNYAQGAGAIAAVLYSTAASPDAVFMVQASANLPAVMLSNSDGLDLQSRISAHSGLTATVTFDVTTVAMSPNSISFFSSEGPGLGFSATTLGVGYSIKPDVVAIGDPISSATQANDPNGELYDPSGFTVASGTSFASPIVAGSTAVLKGARPGLTPAQYRSLIVNSASLLNLDSGGVAGPQVTGGGVLNLFSSMQNMITSAPVSLSFDAGGDTVSAAQTFTLTNIGGSSDTLNLSVVSADGIAIPALSTNSVSIDPGTSQNLSLQLNASGLSPGAYQGYVRVLSSQTNVETHIPYWYAVAGTTPGFIGVLWNDGGADVGGPTIQGAIFFRITDSAGIALGNVTPDVQVVAGGGRVVNVYPADPFLPGVYAVDVRLSRTSGTVNLFQITAGSVTQVVEIDTF